MSYEPTIWRTGDTVTAEKLNKIEQAIVADNTAIEGKVGRDEFDTEIATLESKVGSPLIASTVSEMTETDRVYVYTGSETGYTSGNWYYYDGTAWTSGGVYNAVAIETDTTLSVSGKAADAKKVGDELSSLKEDLNSVKELTIVTDETVVTTDVLNTLTWTSGYMGTNGSTGTASNLRYSNKLSVSKGDVLEVLPTPRVFRFVCAFNGDTPVSASGAENVNTYTVPDGIDGVVLTVYIPASSYAATGINHTTKEYTSKNIYEDNIAELTANVNAIGEAVTVEQYQAETEFRHSQTDI